MKLNKFMELEKFQKYIDKKDYETPYNEIVKSTLELVKEIADKKKLHLEEWKNKKSKDIFYNILFTFEQGSVSFTNIQYLMKEFLNWNIILDEDIYQTKEQILIHMINLYNGVVSELTNYEKVEEDIQENGYKKLEKEKTEKLINLFKEMLQYKNKKYDENWSFEEWIENIDTHYHFYHESLIETLYKIKKGLILLDTDKYYYDSIKVDQVEKIISLTDLYENLNDKDDGYKNYAYFYREFELKEGQTYSDLYKLEQEKYVKLFQDMLDFINVKYDTDYFDDLSVLIREHYPYYNDVLIHLDDMMFSTKETYITILDRMENIYDNLSKNYKNHEKNLAEYEKNKKIEEDYDEFGFDEDEN